jgi:signal transduction histidine kinase
VLLLDEEDNLRVQYTAGQPLLSVDRLPVDGSFAGQVMRTGKPVLVNLSEAGPHPPDLLVQGNLWFPEMTALLGVPLKTDEKVIGVLDVMNKPGGFHADDLRIMQLFADYAAINIEHARLHKQAEQLAVVEERQRLARELHDSVTQALYSVTLYADAARMALSASQWEVVGSHLQELRNMAREAMIDMRLLIFELHSLRLEEEGLAAALQARLSAVEGRAGLQTKMVVENEQRLPLSVEEALYRIAQEGLNNVIKHARAQTICLRLEYLEKAVRLEVIDDGAGFNPEQVRRSGGIGLCGVEERLRPLGGELEILSAPGAGTTLRVTLPRRKPQEIFP